MGNQLSEFMTDSNSRQSQNDTHIIQELLKTLKNELNEFYNILNEHSETNLDDHNRIHHIINQMQQEIQNLKKNNLELEKKINNLNIHDSSFNWDNNGEDFDNNNTYNK